MRLSLAWHWHQLPHIITPALEYAPIGAYRLVRFHFFVGMLTLSIAPNAPEIPTDPPADSPRHRLEALDQLGALRDQARGLVGRQPPQKDEI